VRAMASALQTLYRKLIACRAWPRLVKWRDEVTQVRSNAYQVSQQSMQTGRLSPAMFDAVLKKVSSQ
jgi:uracil-DNA glycosylase